MNPMLVLVPAVARWWPQPDAGVTLQRLETRGAVAVVGDDPTDCLVELRQPVLPMYASLPCLPLDAWLVAWRAHGRPRRDRDLAIRQDFTRFRAGLLVLAHLALHDAELVADVTARARFDEAVVVAHQWFLARQRGGRAQFAALRSCVSPEDIQLEAWLILAGIAHVEEGW
ncbi:MAG: hypothetical protein H0X24_00785 [Ktedonobacterales bacterium]|nr:hypothetical protein [Ktedonobacterales bacterium]